LSALSTLGKGIIRSVEDLIGHELAVRAPRPRIKPRIVRDNPGGDWLESQRRRAKADSPHFSGAVTASTRRPIEMDPRKIRHLPGANGERPVPGTPKYDRLLEQVKRSGGIYEDAPILIGVNHDGKPYILDGNNRTAVADDLGIRAVPAEVRYFAGGEEYAGDHGWDPSQLEKYMAPSELVSSPNFRKWFGGGVLKDEYGEPTPLYHGTNRDFSAFRTTDRDIGVHMGTTGQANDRMDALSKRWLDKGVDNPRVLPVYANFRNPYRMEDIGNFDLDNMGYQLKHLRGEEVPMDMHDIRSMLEDHGYDGVVYKNTGETNGAAPYREAADAALEDWNAVRKRYIAENGEIYPGAFKNDPELAAAQLRYKQASMLYEKYRNANMEDSYAALFPTQIKSRFNRGTFDPYDPDIGKAEGGLIR